MTGSATDGADVVGQRFQVAGPACENARSPNFVRSRGKEKSVAEVDDCERSSRQFQLVDSGSRHVRSKSACELN